MAITIEISFYNGKITIKSKKNYKTTTTLIDDINSYFESFHSTDEKFVSAMIKSVSSSTSEYSTNLFNELKEYYNSIQTITREMSINVWLQNYHYILTFDVEYSE